MHYAPFGQSMTYLYDSGSKWFIECQNCPLNVRSYQFVLLYSLLLETGIVLYYFMELSTSIAL